MKKGSAAHVVATSARSIDEAHGEFVRLAANVAGAQQSVVCKRAAVAMLRTLAAEFCTSEK